MIAWKCYCGHTVYEDSDIKATRICELSDCCPDGNYAKSEFWDKTKDEEDQKKLKSGMAYNNAMKNVTPFDQTRQGKKKGRRVA